MGNRIQPALNSRTSELSICCLLQAWVVSSAPLTYLVIHSKWYFFTFETLGGGGMLLFFFRKTSSLQEEAEIFVIHYSSLPLYTTTQPKLLWNTVTICIWNVPTGSYFEHLLSVDFKRVPLVVFCCPLQWLRLELSGSAMPPLSWWTKLSETMSWNKSFFFMVPLWLFHHINVKAITTTPKSCHGICM